MSSQIHGLGLHEAWQWSNVTTAQGKIRGATVVYADPLTSLLNDAEVTEVKKLSGAGESGTL